MRRWGYVALGSAIALCGCSSKSAHEGPPADGGSEAAPADAGAETGGTSMLQSLTVSTGSLRPDFDPNNQIYDITSINSIYPLTVTATATDPGATLTIQGTPATSGAPSTLTLQPKQDIAVVVTSPGSAPSTYTVHYVPSDFPQYTVQSTPDAGVGNEDVMLDPDGEYVMIVDRAGEPLYYRTFLPQQVENFEQQTLPDGNVFYSTNVGVFDAQGWTLGVDHVMDDHFNDVGDYELLPYAQHGALQAEGHEFLLLEEGHYVVMTFAQRTLDLSAYNPAWSTQAVVMNGVFQEVDNGSVVMEWDSANVPSLYSDSYFENSFGTLKESGIEDYLHLNSIQIDPTDQNFLVSFRHTSSIAKIDRHSGAILWTLGGQEDQFGLTPTQLFSFQHHVRKHADGSITIFDNGNGPEAPHGTRILQFVLDEANHTVTSFQVLYTESTKLTPTGYMGSAVPLSASRLFCGWGGWYSANLQPAASEIINGSPVWTIQFGIPGLFAYRALPIAPL
jgi:hypothetical protein